MNDKSKPSSTSSLDGLRLSGLLVRGKPELTKAMHISVSEIEEDPENVRGYFNDEKLNELAESIKMIGVKTPISVKPHPSKPNTWLINHGARRLRAAKIAGLTEIPAHLDTDHDEFAQLIENVQREDLTDIEISEFIEKMKAAGNTVNDIAKKIGKPASWVSRHTGLHLSPLPILGLVESGRIQGAESIQLMSKLYGASPEAVNALVDESDGRITQKDIRAAVTRLEEGLTSSDEDIRANVTCLEEPLKTPDNVDDQPEHEEPVQKTKKDSKSKASKVTGNFSASDVATLLNCLQLDAKQMELLSEYLSNEEWEQIKNLMG